MAENKIRFGVKADDGRTSNVWTCWTQLEKGDAYLTSDVLGKALKFSDHVTGRSHVAFHREKWDLFAPEVRPSKRFIVTQQKTDAAEEPWRLIACVYFPSGSPHDVPRKAAADTIWLPEAPEGQATEIGLFRFNVETLPGTWPGQRDGTGLVADLPLGDGGHLLIVWRHAAFQMPPPPNDGTRRPFEGMGDDDLLRANRGVAIGRTESGALSFIETKMVVTRNET